MNKNKLSCFILLLIFFPVLVYSEQYYSVGIDRNRPGKPITILHYQDGEWVSQSFPPAEKFIANSAPCLAISPGGKFWMVWAGRVSGFPPRIYFSRKRGKMWSNPQPVSSAGHWDETPVIAFDQAGTPWIAWSRTRFDKTNIVCAAWNGNSFQGEITVSSSDTSPNINPSLGFDKNNNPVLLWEGFDESFYRIYYSRREKNGWSYGEPLSSREGIDQVLPCLYSQAGNLNACWVEKGTRLNIDRKSGKWSQAYKSRIKNTYPPPPLDDYRGWIIISNDENKSLPMRIPLIDLDRKENDNPIFTNAGDYGAGASHIFTGYGDSITYGTTPPGGDPSDYKGYCYIPLLKTMLEIDFPTDIFTIYNGGFPGATTQQLLSGGGNWGCPGIESAITTSQCSQILIMGGTNDVSDQIHPSIIHNNLSAMIDRSRQLDCEPVLATIIPRCDDVSLYYDTKLLDSYYIIPLADSKDCQLADPWQHYMNNDYWCDDYLTWWDHLHPYYPIGSQPIADAWHEAIIVYTPSPTPTPTPPISIIDSGDYNGDGTSDIAIFRPGSGLWSIRGITRVYFGSSSDGPASGDYNNDGTSDLTVFRQPTGLWAARGITRVYYGNDSDRPAPGDYNGDGICDIAIYRENSGLWAVRDVTRCYFGMKGDIPVPGYYRGNREKLFAVFRPSNGLWACRDFTRFYFGADSDLPIAADYSGDGTDQSAIFRSSNGLWAIRGISRFFYGMERDRPVPASYQGTVTEAAIFREATGLWALRGISRIYYGTNNDIPVMGRIPHPITPAPTSTPVRSPSPTPSVCSTSSPVPTPTFTVFPTLSATPTPTT